MLCTTGDDVSYSLENIKFKIFFKNKFKDFSKCIFKQIIIAMCVVLYEYMWTNNAMRDFIHLNIMKR